MSQPAARPTTVPAKQLCPPEKLSAPARLLLTDDPTAGEFVEQLRREQLFPDGLQFAVHLLPKRSAVWWACLCIWQVQRPEPVPAVAAIFHATVRWVRDPSEDNRRATETVAQPVAIVDPAAALAQAVVWSGGSMNPLGLPEVPPPPDATGNMIVGALQASAARVQYDRRSIYYRHCLKLALDVAGGKLPWRLPSEGA